MIDEIADAAAYLRHEAYLRDGAGKWGRGELRRIADMLETVYGDLEAMRQHVEAANQAPAAAAPSQPQAPAANPDLPEIRKRVERTGFGDRETTVQAAEDRRALLGLLDEALAEKARLTAVVDIAEETLKCLVAGPAPAEQFWRLFNAVSAAQYRRRKRER